MSFGRGRFVPYSRDSGILFKMRSRTVIFVRYIYDSINKMNLKQKNFLKRNAKIRGLTVYSFKDYVIIDEGKGKSRLLI